MFRSIDYGSKKNSIHISVVLQLVSTSSTTTERKEKRLHKIHLFLVFYANVAHTSKVTLFNSYTKIVKIFHLHFFFKSEHFIFSIEKNRNK